MYACMYARMHICMYVCTYVCMYVCTYAHMYVCMYGSLWERVVVVVFVLKYYLILRIIGHIFSLLFFSSHMLLPTKYHNVVSRDQV